jgi:hypothetical protein
MTKLVFIDTETTSLRPDRRAWDIGLIVRQEGQEDREQSWFVDWADLDLGNADPFALKIGGFYDAPAHLAESWRDVTVDWVTSRWGCQSNPPCDREA